MVNQLIKYHLLYFYCTPFNQSINQFFISDHHSVGSSILGQFRGKRDKGLEEKLLTGHIVIVYFYRP